MLHITAATSPDTWFIHCRVACHVWVATSKHAAAGSSIEVASPTGTSLLQDGAARLSRLQAPPGFGSCSECVVLQALACAAWCLSVGTARQHARVLPLPPQGQPGRAAAMWREQALHAGSNV